MVLAENLGIKIVLIVIFDCGVRLLCRLMSQVADVNIQSIVGMFAFQLFLNSYHLKLNISCLQ